MVHCKPFVNKKAKRKHRRAKSQQCFSDVGANDRIHNNFKIWQKVLKLPGSEESWLRMLPGGNFQCKCCFFRAESFPHKFKSLASAEGLRPTVWTRLQTFRQHETTQHAINATLYVRATMPDAPAAKFASPAHDFLEPIRSVKQNKVNTTETYGKRKKIRAMTYCLAEACRRRKHRLF